MANTNVEATYAKRSKRWKVTLTLLVAALVATIIVALDIGFAPISFSEILRIIAHRIPFLNGI